MDSFGRPAWYEYYLALAFLVSGRSIDPRTKHGAVIVSKDNRLLATGYNGPIRGVNNSTVPLTAPTKYFHMLHAEENALLSYNGSFQDIVGATCYVTGECCHKCLRMLIQKGITRIVHGNVGSVMLDVADTAEKESKELMIEQSNIKVYAHNDAASIRKVLENSLIYFDLKNG